MARVEAAKMPISETMSSSIEMANAYDNNSSIVTRQQEQVLSTRSREEEDHRARLKIMKKPKKTSQTSRDKLKRRQHSSSRIEPFQNPKESEYKRQVSPKNAQDQEDMEKVEALLSIPELSACMTIPQIEQLADRVSLVEERHGTSTLIQNTGQSLTHMFVVYDTSGKGEHLYFRGEDTIKTYTNTSDLHNVLLELLVSNKHLTRSLWIKSGSERKVFQVERNVMLAALGSTVARIQNRIKKVGFADDISSQHAGYETMENLTECCKRIETYSCCRHRKDRKTACGCVGCYTQQDSDRNNQGYLLDSTFDEVTRRERFWWAENKCLRVGFILLFVVAYVAGVFGFLVLFMSKLEDVPPAHCMMSESVTIEIQNLHCTLAFESSVFDYDTDRDGIEDYVDPGSTLAGRLDPRSKGACYLHNIPSLKKAVLITSQLGNRVKNTSSDKGKITYTTRSRRKEYTGTSCNIKIEVDHSYTGTVTVLADRDGTAELVLRRFTAPNMSLCIHQANHLESSIADTITISRSSSILIQMSEIHSLSSTVSDISIQIMSTRIMRANVRGKRGWINIDDCQARNLNFSRHTQTCLKASSFSRVNLSNGSALINQANGIADCWAYCAEEERSDYGVAVTNSNLCTCKGSIAFGLGDQWIVKNFSALQVLCTAAHFDTVSLWDSNIPRVCKCSSSSETTSIDVDLSHGSLFSSPMSKAVFANKFHSFDTIIRGNFDYNVSSSNVQYLQMALNVKYPIRQLAIIKILGPRQANRTWYASDAVVFRLSPELLAALSWTTMKAEKLEVDIPLDQTKCQTKLEQDYCRILGSDSSEMQRCRVPGKEDAIETAQLVELHGFIRAIVLDPILQERAKSDPADPSITQYVLGTQKNIGHSLGRLELKRKDESQFAVFEYDKESFSHVMSRPVEMHFWDIVLICLLLLIVSILLYKCGSAAYKAAREGELQYTGDMVFSDLDAQVDLDVLLNKSPSFAHILSHAAGVHEMKGLSQKIVKPKWPHVIRHCLRKHLQCCCECKDAHTQPTKIADVTQPSHIWFKTLRQFPQLVEIASEKQNRSKCCWCCSCCFDQRRHDKQRVAFLDSLWGDAIRAENTRENNELKIPIAGIVTSGLKATAVQASDTIKDPSLGMYLINDKSNPVRRFYPTNLIRKGTNRIAFLISFNARNADLELISVLEDNGYKVLLIRKINDYIDLPVVDQLDLHESETEKKQRGSKRRVTLWSKISDVDVFEGIAGIEIPQVEGVKPSTTPIIFSRTRQQKLIPMSSCEKKSKKVAVWEQGWNLQDYNDLRAKQLLNITDKKPQTWKQLFKLENAGCVTPAHPVLLCGHYGKQHSEILRCLMRICRYKSKLGPIANINPKSRLTSLQLNPDAKRAQHPLTGGVMLSETFDTPKFFAGKHGTPSSFAPWAYFAELDSDSSFFNVGQDAMVQEGDMDKSQRSWYFCDNTTDAPLIFMGAIFAFDSENYRISLRQQEQQSRLLQGAISWLGKGYNVTSLDQSIVELKWVSITKLQYLIELSKQTSEGTDRLQNQMMKVMRKLRVKAEHRRGKAMRREREQFVQHMANYKDLMAVQDRMYNRVSVLRSFTDIIYFSEMLLKGAETSENPSIYETLYRQMEHKSFLTEIGAWLLIVGQACLVIVPLGLWFCMVMAFRTYFFLDLPDETSFSRKTNDLIQGITWGRTFSDDLKVVIVFPNFYMQSTLLIPPYVVGIGLFLCVYAALDVLNGLDSFLLHETKFEIGMYWHKVLEWRKISKEQQQRRSKLNDSNSWMLWRGFRAKHIYPPPPIKTGGFCFCLNQNSPILQCLRSGGVCSYLAFLGTYCAASPSFSSTRACSNCCCHCGSFNASRRRRRVLCTCQNCHSGYWRKWEDRAQSDSEFRANNLVGDLVRVKLPGWHNMFIGRVVNVWEDPYREGEMLYDISFVDKRIPVLYDYRLPEAMNEISIDEELGSPYSRRVKVAHDLYDSISKVLPNEKQGTNSRDLFMLTTGSKKLRVTALTGNSDSIHDESGSQGDNTMRKERRRVIRKRCRSICGCLCTGKEIDCPVKHISLQRIAGIGPLLKVASEGDLVRVLFDSGKFRTAWVVKIEKTIYHPGEANDVDSTTEESQLLKQNHHRNRKPAKERSLSLKSQNANQNVMEQNEVNKYHIVDASIIDGISHEKFSENQDSVCVLKNLEFKEGRVTGDGGFGLVGSKGEKRKRWTFSVELEQEQNQEEDFLSTGFVFIKSSLESKKRKCAIQFVEPYCVKGIVTQSLTHSTYEIKIKSSDSHISTEFDVHYHCFAHSWYEVSCEEDEKEIHEPSHVESLEFLSMKLFRNSDQSNFVIDNRDEVQNNFEKENSVIYRLEKIPEKPSTYKVWMKQNSRDQDKVIIVQKRWKDSVSRGETIYVRLGPMLRNLNVMNYGHKKKALVRMIQKIHLIDLTQKSKRNDENFMCEVGRKQIFPIHSLISAYITDQPFYTNTQGSSLLQEPNYPIPSWWDKKESESGFFAVQGFYRSLKNFHWVILALLSFSVVVVGVLSLILGVLVLPERIIPLASSAVSLICASALIYQSLSRMLKDIENKFVAALLNQEASEQDKVPFGDTYRYYHFEGNDDEEEESEDRAMFDLKRRKVLQRFGFSEKNIIRMVLWLILELCLIFAFILAGLFVFGGETTTSATISTVLISTSGSLVTLRYSKEKFWDSEEDAQVSKELSAGDIAGIVGALVREYNKSRHGSGVGLQDTLENVMRKNRHANTHTRQRRLRQEV